MIHRSITSAAAMIAMSLVMVLLDVSAGHASSFEKQVDHNRLGFSASRYTQAGGSSDSGDSGTSRSRPQRIQYLTVPWMGQCNTATQICTPVSERHCQRQHKDNKDNKWRPFNVYISYDGHTFEGFPDTPLHRGVCLNTVALNAPDRAPLDPQLVFREVTKLVPKGAWHPQPNGQAVVNKPVIVTVETDRDQTFKPFTLLGYHVEVKAHIDAYEWQYGDGTPATTVDWPGQDFSSALGGCTAADCSNYVNHDYPHAGTYNIQLTLHWTATYRADGGAWQPVPGNITTTSPAQNIQILNAHSQLVNGN